MKPHLTINLAIQTQEYKHSAKKLKLISSNDAEDRSKRNVSSCLLITNSSLKTSQVAQEYKQEGQGDNVDLSLAAAGWDCGVDADGYLIK